MYQFYHQLALDMVPFDTEDEFRILELGCGTGNFLQYILEKFSKGRCVAFDYSVEILKYAAQKVARYSDRIEFHQRDLHDGLPSKLGPFDLVSSFSTIHLSSDWGPHPLGWGGKSTFFCFFLDNNCQKCYTISTSWQALRALPQGNVLAYPLVRG